MDTKKIALHIAYNQAMEQHNTAAGSEWIAFRPAPHYYGSDNPLYQYDMNAPMVPWDQPFPLPATEKDGALVYRGRMINLQQNTYPSNGTLEQLLQSKATKVCLYQTRFVDVRTLYVFMALLPMTMTELVIHHTAVFGDPEISALIRVLRRSQLKAVELKIRLLDPSVIEAIRDNPSITSLVLHQPYKDDKKVLGAIMTLVSRKTLEKWTRFEYYPHYQMDTLTMAEYVRVLKYAPNLTKFGLNMDQNEGDMKTFFHQLAKSKLVTLTMQSKSGNHYGEALEAIRKMKHLKELTISGHYWVDLSMAFVLSDGPKLERVNIFSGDSEQVEDRIRLWSSCFKWPLKHVGYANDDGVHPEAKKALHRIKMRSRLVQVMKEFYYIDRPLINIDMLREIASFIKL